MAKTRVKKGKAELPIVHQITINNTTMASHEIKNWRSAINAARSAHNPRRRTLIDLYEDIKIDGHLESVMDKRRTSITNKKILWIANDGKANEQVEELIIRAPWFYNLRGHVIDAKAFGYSLIELILEKGKVKEVELIARQNVFPEYGFVAFSFGTSSPSPDAGIYFEQDPAYANTTLFIGGKKNYGKLMTAAQYVIYKRGAIGDWSQFAELFGMPLRDGSYDPFDPESRKRLEDAFENSGSASWIVKPKGTEINYHDANQSGKAEVYDLLTELCNAEMSKVFLGQTMTTDNGSSRSQSEVHQDVEDEIHISDMIEMEYLLNWNLKPKLLALGYPVSDGRFCYPETNKLPLDKLIEVISKVAAMVDVDEEFIYKTFGVEKPKPGTNPVRLQQASSLLLPGGANKPEEKKPDTAEEPADKTEKKKLSSNLHFKLARIYGKCHKCRSKLVKLSAGNTPVNTGLPSHLLDRITKDIHSGSLKPGQIDPDLVRWTASELFKGVTGGYGKIIGEVPSESKDYNMLKSLDQNVHVFSGFKSYHQLREATDQLKDADGNIKSFEKFREDILSINDKYNVTYLEAEYQQAIAASQSCSQWVDIEAGKETMPTLTYRTAGDDAVRPEHAMLEGTTRPVDDEFWDEYYPPNDWGCRCDVVQGDDAVTDLDPGTLPELKDSFAINWGKEEIVFPENHPYFDVSQETKNDVNEQLKNMKDDENKDS